ncbi:MAG TPA: RNA helicase [Spirochaetia bacterium]|nr:MAG: RNA helicase [Spirochaetes bacterium GWB1_36_13]HCL56771.1 RNA helicase [Spirochaetia bacterium]
MENLEKFRALGLSENVIEALKIKGFEEPSPIQELTIPLLLNGEKDIIGQAQTGTGKTAAFGLPLIERIEEKNETVQALILVPTRELAIQVAEEIHSLKGKKRLYITPIYGGQSIDQQIKKLKRGVHIVVGTPGRIIDHINRKTLKLANLSYAILDEADEMLNMGFIDDIKEILGHTPENKRMLLFSATMPDEIMMIARKYMKDYEIVRVQKETLTTNLTDQIYFEVSHNDKFEALCRIIDIESEFYGLIFCRTKIDADQISNQMIERGYDAEALHGDISQFQRENILAKFKKKRINILVATDVAARGIDINNLTHVINYSLPQDPESYVHRIGRTGRAGKEGTAITFVTPEEYRKLVFIKRISKTEIRKEKLPKIQDVINAKKTRIKNKILSILENGEYEDFSEIAKDILEGKEAEQVLASVMKHFFEDELDLNSYNEIQDVSVNTKGKSRLFVAMGKMDNMTPKKVVDFIKQEAKIDENKIRDVKIFEAFSFITVPFEEAEIILRAFKSKNRGRRPIVERAKEKR